MASAGKHDRLTVVAIAALARVIQTVVHEGLGHGVAAWLSGAHSVTISAVAENADVDNRWIFAAGTLANLVAALVFWVLLRIMRRSQPATRCFLIFNLAFALFSGTGYFFFSGITNFGDWAKVIEGLPAQWAWRLGLILTGAASYYASMLVVAAELKAYRGLLELCWTAYITAAVLAVLAGIPGGFFLILVSALPSSLGANAGFLALPSMIRRPGDSGPVGRSLTWIITGAIASLVFILMLGGGLTFVR